MVQTTNRFFDEMARLMNDAAGVAQGARREFDTMLRAQAERFMRDMDLVKREEFDAVKEMARLAREENEAQKVRIAALEAAGAPAPVVTPLPPRPESIPPRPGPIPTTMAASPETGSTAASASDVGAQASPDKSPPTA